jgi:membrane protein YdbS with pleckstrin-like domain
MSDPRNVWKNLNTKGRVMSSAEVRIKAQKIEREIRRDTTIFLVLACAFAVFAGIAMFQERGGPPRIITGFAVVLMGLGVWRTLARRKRLSAARSMTCLEFCRNELRRRRDYFAKTPWGLIFAVLVALFLFQVSAHNVHASPGILRPFLAALLVLASIALPLWRREARKFQRELDELEKFDRNDSPAGAKP